MYKCAIYLHKLNDIFSENYLFDAQMYALDNELPLAVVSCVDSTDKNQQIKDLNVLQQYEEDLLNLNIPLIALIGEEKSVLPGFYSHLKPKVFSKTDNLQNVSKHPINWPGKVIKASELIQLIKAGKITC